MSNVKPSGLPAVHLSRIRPASPAAGLTQAATVQPVVNASADKLRFGGRLAVPASCAISAADNARPITRGPGNRAAEPAAAVGGHAHAPRMRVGRQRERRGAVHEDPTAVPELAPPRCVCLRADAAFALLQPVQLREPRVRGFGLRGEDRHRQHVPLGRRRRLERLTRRRARSRRRVRLAPKVRFSRGSANRSCKRLQVLHLQAELRKPTACCGDTTRREDCRTRPRTSGRTVGWKADAARPLPE